MSIDLSIWWIGLVGGITMGLTGVGAGSVINSLLLLFVPGLGLTGIVASSAVQGTVLKLMVSWREFVDYEPLHRDQVGWMIAGALPATIIGSSWLLHWLSDVALFRTVLYVVLALASLVILIESVLFRWSREDDEPQGRQCPKWQLMLWGVLLGLIVGATSIGTGTLMITSLMLWLRFPVKRAVALALWSGGIILMMAAVSHLAQNHVDWSLLGNLMVGSIPGILGGKLLRNYISPTPLRISVALLIFYLMSRNLLHVS